MVLYSLDRIPMAGPEVWALVRDVRDMDRCPAAIARLGAILLWLYPSWGREISGLGPDVLLL
jgi:hypothetical protein